jgi:DNA-binding response OmpR family regulator
MALNGENGTRTDGAGERVMAKRVLVVDDEPNIVMSLRFLMEREGLAVEVAPTGEAALQALGRTPADLVLLDVMMPEIDGFEVCQRIRANPAWAKTPIIMLTAKGRDVERDKGRALGADEYITKPFSTRELVARIKQMLASG